ncbi:MAG TPA: hypothetical protein VEZ72_14965 [Paenibacillus sp.]|nr:hypothetical protein [Paenibacillus sp.]
MAETFRKSKVEHYISMLTLRRDTLKQQLERAEFDGQRQYLQGQLSAIDLIVNEILCEFALDPSQTKSKMNGEEQSS